MEIRRNIVTIMLLCTALGAAAQQRFTDRITARRAGDGTVVLHQDATLEALVNGITRPVAKPATPSTTGTTTPEANAEEVDDNGVVDLGDGRKVYRNSIKMQGYRVQVYSGGNSRKAKQAAEQAARHAKSEFPNQPVYTHFASPRWICRVGDFRSIEEANELLRQMKENGSFPQAVIVKSTVQIPF